MADFQDGEIPIDYYMDDLGARNENFGTISKKSIALLKFKTILESFPEKEVQNLLSYMDALDVKYKKSNAKDHEKESKNAKKNLDEALKKGKEK